MIGNFETYRPSLCLNSKKINFSDLTGAVSIFLFTPSKYLTLTQAAILSNWQTSVANKEIFPIHNIKDSIDESEEPVILVSKQDFRYQARRGKYRLSFLINCDVDYFILLKKYEGQNLKLIIGDKNGNLLGIKDGTNFKPFTIASLMVKKIVFGAFAKNSTVSISIDLADPIEIESGYSFKPSFRFRDVFNEQVTISSIEDIDTTTIKFKVTNGCSEAVADLIAADIILTDEISGVLTINTFTNLGAGFYTYKSNQSQYLGTIKVLNIKYNGLNEYTFLEPEFNPTEFSSDFKIT